MHKFAGVSLRLDGSLFMCLRVCVYETFSSYDLCFDVQDWHRQAAWTEGCLLRLKRSYYRRRQPWQCGVCFPVKRPHYSQVWFTWFLRPRRSTFLCCDTLGSRCCRHWFSQSLCQGTECFDHFVQLKQIYLNMWYKCWLPIYSYKS